MLILCTFTVRKPRDIILKGNFHHIGLCILSGFVAVFLAQLCFCLGLTLSDAAFTAPWMLLNPIFTTILGLILGYEKSVTLKTIGLSCSLLGTFGLIMFSSFTQSESTYDQSLYTASLFLFISSMSQASGVIIWRKLLVENDLSPLIVSTWSLFFGTIFMFCAFLLKPFWYPWKEIHSVSTQLHGCSSILSCCFIIMLGYGITYSILTWATHKSSISIVALYASARPLFTVILSFIIVQQDLWKTSIDALLLTIVLFGLLVSSYSKREEKIKKLNLNKNNLEEDLKKKFDSIPAGPCQIFIKPPKSITMN